MSKWLTSYAERQRSRDSLNGLRLLGTNAVTAIPELKAMLGACADLEGPDIALQALVSIGEPSIPALEAALAEPQQVYRWHILWGFSELVRQGHTNRCLPKLMEALADTDVTVRLAATNLVLKLAPQLLANAPAQP